MNKKIVLLFMVIILGIMTAGCTNHTAESYELKIMELEKKLQESERAISSLRDELSRYKDFTDPLINRSDEQTLLVLAKSQWEYTVRVDEKQVPADGSIEVGKKDFEIAISESQNPFSILPGEVHIKGRISGQYNDHIRFINRKPDSTEAYAGTVVEGVHYMFSGISNDTVIKLEVTEELRERIGLQSKTINISVKY